MPISAAADPINVRVTDGELVVPGSGLGDLNLIGEGGFSLTGRVDPRFGVFMPYAQCVSIPECPAGTNLSLRAFWSGFDIRSGVVTYDGRTYPLREFDGASAAVSFIGSVVLPPLAPSAVLTAPFELVPFDSSRGGSLFAFPYPDSLLGFLYGSGTATITLSPYGPFFPDSWTVDSVRYEFSAADPVPEPATMVMVGLGIAGIARRVSRKRRGI